MISLFYFTACFSYFNHPLFLESPLSRLEGLASYLTIQTITAITVITSATISHFLGLRVSIVSLPPRNLYSFFINVFVISLENRGGGYSSQLFVYWSFMNPKFIVSLILVVRLALFLIRFTNRLTSSLCI